MAPLLRFDCAKCGLSHFIEPASQPAPNPLCRGCGAEMIAAEMITALLPLGQANLAGSPDDPEVTLAWDGEATTASLSAGKSTEGVRRSGRQTTARYVEQALIGRGGMGEVVLCIDRNIRRPIALKRILPSQEETPAQRARFVEEGQITGQLEHPNIVPVHELERTPDGTIYFTMKLVHGRPLAALIKAAKEGQETPSLIDLLQVFLKICNGVAFAHSRGVVHRDLKPSNIMLGDFGEVLVMDWGLAKLVGPADQKAVGSWQEAAGRQPEKSAMLGSAADCRVLPADLVSPPVPLPSAQPQVRTDRHDDGISPTLDGSALGTPAYMSPEQAMGKVDEICPRSDIYSLGAILYELLTLERAIAGEHPHDVLANAIRGHIVPPQRRTPDRYIPRELADDAMKCLATKPEDRYRSVIELRDDVSLFLEGREAWLPVCSLDFTRDKIDERLEAVDFPGELAGEAQYEDGTAGFSLGADGLRIENSLGIATGTRHRGFAALHWREPVGEETRVAVTMQNESGTPTRHSIRITVSGDTLTGYRLDVDNKSHLCLETVAHGYWEVLQRGLIPLDLSRPQWHVVLERSGHWVRATVDGQRAIEFFDPLPLCGPAHRKFGISSKDPGTVLTRIEAWKRRRPENVSVLEPGRVLLANGHFAEAAYFFAEQVSTPRGTPLDDQARMLLGLAREKLEAFGDALDAYTQVAESSNKTIAATARLRTARLLILQGHLAQAGHAAHHAKAINPGLPAAESVHSALIELCLKPVDTEPSHQDPEGLRLLADLIGRAFTPTPTLMASLQPISVLPIETLDYGYTPRLPDLSPLSRMPLRKAVFSGSTITDLAPLKGLALDQIILNRTPISDLSPLNGMPLRQVTLAECPNVTDLRPLAGAPISFLHFQFSQVTDLSPLIEMPLTDLACSGSPIDSLEPLRGLPLKFLWIDRCDKIADLTPLEGMELQGLSFTPKNIARGIEAMRAMKTLEQVGDLRRRLWPAEEFWERYDAGEFG